MFETGTVTIRQNMSDLSTSQDKLGIHFVAHELGDVSEQYYRIVARG